MDGSNEASTYDPGSESGRAMPANPIEQQAVRTILDSLAAGPRTVAEMPRSWPVTRTVLRLTVRRLIDAGVVEAVAAPRPLLRLTPRGRGAGTMLPSTAT